MTAREHILEYLKRHEGFVLSSDIHNHLCAAGYKRNTSDSGVSKMVTAGELLREGEHHNSRCMINPDFVPEPVAEKMEYRKPTRAERHKKLPLCDNGIFDHYRAGSRVYEMDKMLRQVRI